MQPQSRHPAQRIGLLSPWGYAIKVLKCVGIISLIWVLNYFDTPGNLISYGILCWMAARSSEGALKALLISSLIINGNSFFMHLGVVAGVGRFAVLGIAAIRIFFDASKSGQTLRGGGYLSLLFAFCFFTAIGTFINQYFVVVSLLKLAVFLFGAYVVLAGPLSVRLRHDVLNLWFFSAAVFVVVGSVIIYPTDIGYFKDAEVMARLGLTLFCGMLNHSQTFGVSLVMIYVYTLSLYLFSNMPLRRWLPVMLVCILGLSYLSDSRTALLTIVGASVLGAIIFSFDLYRAKVLNVAGRLRVLILVAGVALCGYTFKQLYFSESPFGAITQFVSKNRVGALNLEELTSGRDRIVASSFNRFLDNPVFGIGFGTDLSYEFQSRATWYTAPTEKSFMPTAVLEETGIVGFILIYAFIGTFLVFLFRTRNLPGLLAFIVMLVLNFGEMMFFSFGGLGSLVWVYLSGCLLIGDPRSFPALVRQSKY
jgi:O-antigen ligase